jgi:hypothetical protein
MKFRRPSDSNQLAKSVVEIATGQAKDLAKVSQDAAKTSAAVNGAKGGLKGGKARAEILTATRRSEIAKKAAAARWKT